MGTGRKIEAAVWAAALLLAAGNAWAQDGAPAAEAVEPAPAIDPEVERILGLAQQGMELERAGRYAEALPPLGEAYQALARQAPPQNRWRLNTALSLANSLDRLRRRREAASILAHENQALIEAGQDAATDAPYVAYALARVLNNDNRFEEAGAAAQRACDLYARPEHGANTERCRQLDMVRPEAGMAVDLTPEQAAEVQARRDLRDLTRAMDGRDPDAAEAAFARLLAWYEATEGAQAPLSLELRGLRAEWRQGLGRIDEALAEAADIHALSAQARGEADPGTLSLLQAYTRTALAAGQTDDAFARLEAARPAVAQAKGSGSVEALRLATWRADLLQGVGRYDEAAGVLETALAAASDLSVADPDRLGARISQAALLPLRGRHREGVEALIALLDEQGDTEGVDQTRLNQARIALAEGLLIDGRVDEADQILDSALQAWPADARKTMQSRAVALMLMSMVRRQQSRIPAALDLARQADAILATRAPTSLMRIRAMRVLGSTLVAAERYGEAGEVLRDTAALEARILGEDHPEIATTLLALAEAQYEAGAVEASSATLTRAVLQAERQFGRGHMFVGSAYNQAALLAWRADQMQEAGRLIDIAVDSCGLPGRRKSADRAGAGHPGRDHGRERPPGRGGGGLSDIAGLADRTAGPRPSAGGGADVQYRRPDAARTGRRRGRGHVASRRRRGPGPASARRSGPDAVGERPGPATAGDRPSRRGPTPVSRPGPGSRRAARKVERRSGRGDRIPAAARDVPGPGDRRLAGGASPRRGARPAPRLKPDHRRAIS